MTAASKGGRYFASKRVAAVVVLPADADQIFNGNGNSGEWPECLAAGASLVEVLGCRESWGFINRNERTQARIQTLDPFNSLGDGLLGGKFTAAESQMCFRGSARHPSTFLGHQEGGVERGDAVGDMSEEMGEISLGRAVLGNTLHPGEVHSEGLARQAGSAEADRGEGS